MSISIENISCTGEEFGYIGQVSTKINLMELYRKEREMTSYNRFLPTLPMSH